MVLTWPAIQHPIKFIYVLDIFATHFLIPPTDAELIDGHICTREGHKPQHLRVFPKKNLVLTHYMISALWLHLLSGLGHYDICPQDIEQVMVIFSNLITFGYTYYKRRIKSPPDTIYTLRHIGRIATQTSLRLTWDLALQGRDRPLNCMRPYMSFTRTNNQEGLTAFDTYIHFTLWDSGFTHFINPYFELYTYYKPLDIEDDMEVNIIGEFVKPQGIETIIPYL